MAFAHGVQRPIADPSTASADETMPACDLAKADREDATTATAQWSQHSKAPTIGPPVGFEKMPSWVRAGAKGDQVLD
jgi:hypothetical protein